jgi:hypothetical protein
MRLLHSSLRKSFFRGEGLWSGRLCRPGASLEGDTIPSLLGVTICTVSLAHTSMFLTPPVDVVLDSNCKLVDGLEAP